MAKVRSPLEPMSTAVKALVTAIAVAIGVGLLAVVFVKGASVLGIGDKFICAVNTAITVGDGDGPLPGLRAAPGATVDLDSHPDYCTDAPSTGQSLLNSATEAAPFAFTVGALLLLLRLIRGAERDGLYAARTAERLRGLGWWLLVGSVVAAIAASTAEKALLDSLSRDSVVSVVSGLWSWDFPFMAILTGLGVLSFARIMRVGIAMREDLDGTV